MKSYISNRLRASRERGLAVEAGQVVCPRQGVIDVESCWMCPAYGGLTTGAREGVICGTQPAFLSIAARWPVGYPGSGEHSDR